MREVDDGRWLLYGAYGYTGRLIARRAVERGHAPVLAGRDRRKTEALARELGLTARVFELRSAAEIGDHLDGVDAFLHTAGPFLETWRPVAEACLDARVHYLDITGEVDVFEGLAAMGERARQAEVALLPGAGFDVVPTDCAAVRAASGLDEPVRLEIAFAGSGGPSRGSMRTVLTGLDRPARERVDGRLVPRTPGSATREIPYSDRRRLGVLGSWGDLATAWRSTGVPNIRTYLPIRPEQLRWLKMMRPWMRLPGSEWLARAWVDRAFDGPDTGELAGGWGRVWCEATDASGRTRVAELVTPNPYALTADAAVACVERLLGAVDRPAGFLTPASAFGADFVSELDGVRWVRA